jgi:nitrogen fixation protein FixH
MNWGTKIALVYGGFAAFMAFLVVFCVKQPDIHLVSQEYYKEEIAYQHQIDQLQRAQQRKGRLQFQYDAKAQSVQVVIPDGKQVNGEVHFFRPSDARLDKQLPLQLHQGAQLIPVGSLAKGAWKVKIHWSEGAQEFLEEQSFILQ